VSGPSGQTHIVVRNNVVRLGKWFAVSFERTLRIPDDGRVYPLPPGLGRFPLRSAHNFATSVPPAWREHDDLFMPMYQREALWLSFDGMPWHPCVVQVGIGGINAVSGTDWEQRLTDAPQNYLICPDQPWLDGINAGEGIIRQFLAMPLGLDVTVEAQLTGREETGGIQMRVYQAKPGRFPERAPRSDSHAPVAMSATTGGMGLAAGGTMRQKIYPDVYGLDTWDTTRSTALVVHIVNSAQYRALTGRRPPATPIDARAYTDNGLPWFDLYDEDRGHVAPGRRLTSVKSVRQKEAETLGASGDVDAESIEIPPQQIQPLQPPR
jgi:hypothetical protein